MRLRRITETASSRVTTPTVSISSLRNSRVVSSKNVLADETRKRPSSLGDTSNVTNWRIGGSGGRARLSRGVVSKIIALPPSCMTDILSLGAGKHDGSASKNHHTVD